MSPTLEPWQMTLDEYQQAVSIAEKRRIGSPIPRRVTIPPGSEWDAMTRNWHRQEIESALAASIEVGEHVLAGHPTIRRPAQSEPASCPHLPHRVYSWLARDDRIERGPFGPSRVACAACCDCGAVLSGGA